MSVWGEGDYHDRLDQEVAQETLRRLHRELRAISSCNQILMRAVNEQALLEDVCRIICAEAGYRMAWVGYAENDPAKTVRPVAWAGAGDEGIWDVQVVWADTEYGRGATGMAIRSGASACIQDFLTSPQAAPWREGALRLGLRSDIGLPLKGEDGHVFGALTIYSERPDAFTLDEIRLLEELAGDLAFGIGVLRARGERKRAEEERLAHLWFFESMDRVNRAIQGTVDLEQMLRDVLDAVLAIFNCDRAWLAYPCDLHAPSWWVPMERCRPGYQAALGEKFPMDVEATRIFRQALESEAPLAFGPGSGRPLPERVAAQFAIRSMLSMPVYPRVDRPYLFGLHQCSAARTWTADEMRLLQEIGRRLADALSSLVVHRELLASESRYRRITEGITDYLYSVRIENGRPVETRQSPACVTVTGYTADEFAADPYLWFRMIAPEDRERVGEYIQRILDGEEVPSIEHRICRKDGQVRWISDTVILFKDNTGRLLAYDGVIKDITESKRAADEIFKLNQELERRVVERTAQLEAANKELEAFAYSVSHDLRAPLRHIGGYMELLQEQIAATLNAEGQEYMQAIFNATHRMSALIDDLLSFSRMGRCEMASMPVDLDNLVTEVIRELAPETANRAIDWKIAPLPVVCGDRSMLRVVLVNLLSNAVKFTRPCERAEIEIGSQAGQGGEMVIFVRDNGVGFDMTYAGKLFGVFQRLHRSDEFEGAGIGLANVRRIIHRHGGRTWAEGSLERGATFYFSLPAGPV